MFKCIVETVNHSIDHYAQVTGSVGHIEALCTVDYILEYIVHPFPYEKINRVADIAQW